MATSSQVRESLVRVCGDFRDMAPALARAQEVRQDSTFPFELRLTPVQVRIMAGAIKGFPTIGELHVVGKTTWYRIPSRPAHVLATQIVRVVANAAFAGARQGIMYDMNEYRLAAALLTRLESVEN